MTIPGLRRVGACAPLAALLMTSCTGVDYRYDYTPARQVHPWGEFAVGLHTTNAYYRDGVSMMNGPYRFVVTARIKDGATVPATCKVRFRKAELLDAKGAVEARIPPQDISLQTSPAPKDNPLGKLAMMYASPQGDVTASMPSHTVEVPYQDHTVAVDVGLEGCGQADGAYQIRDIIRTNYQKRRFNPAFDALMSV